MKDCSGCQYLVECLGSWGHTLRFIQCDLCMVVFETNPQFIMQDGFTVPYLAPPKDCWRWLPATFRCYRCQQQFGERRVPKEDQRIYLLGHKKPVKPSDL